LDPAVIFIAQYQASPRLGTACLRSSGDAIFAEVSVIESILKDLKDLPTPKLLEVARYVHGLSEAAQKERLSLLRQTHGALSEEDGQAFELALASARGN
jgi:hypothetical protein